MPDLGPFQSAKLALREMVGLEKDTLHIITGLLVFAIIVVISRKPWSIVPLLAVVAVAVAGEAWDLYELVAIRGRAWEDIPWHELWHDIWVTSLMPAAIFLMAFAVRPKQTLSSGDVPDPAG